MSETLINVENVSKKFCRDLKKSLWYGVKDILSEATNRDCSKPELRLGEFWSINGVSFKLKRGECLGLIGPNGAGKSTLLKMLTGLIKPDKGRISMRGRVGALIELGAGFNPILTGRENIYINGAVLGFTKKEIAQKFDEIVEFAEIREFLDTPVQNYSSGMKVRLGFAIAAQMEPDVLIIDEVLAVGDTGFKVKCLNRVSEILKNAAVILVSHSMPIVNRYCTNSILLSSGEILETGPPAKTIEKYFSLFNEDVARKTSLEGNELINFKFLNSINKHKNEIKYHNNLRLEIACEIDLEIKFPIFKILFLNRDFQVVASWQSSKNKIINRNGLVNFSIDIGPVILSPSKYKVSLVVHREKMDSPIIWYDSYWDLHVSGGRRDFGSEIVHFGGYIFSEK